MSLKEEIETLVPSPLNNNDRSGIILAHKDKMHPSITHPMLHNGWITPQSLWTLIETECQIADKGTTMVKETTAATTFMDKGTPTTIKGTRPNTTLKGTLPPLQTPQTPASNVET